MSSPIQQMVDNATSALGGGGSRMGGKTPKPGKDDRSAAIQRRLQAKKVTK